MKDVFVMLEGDIVQWAHAQAAAKGTTVTSLLSTMLRERMDQALSPMRGTAPADQTAAMTPGWSLAAVAASDTHWPRPSVDDD